MLTLIKGIKSTAYLSQISSLLCTLQYIGTHNDYSFCCVYLSDGNLTDHSIFMLNGLIEGQLLFKCPIIQLTILQGRVCRSYIGQTSIMVHTETISCFTFICFHFLNSKQTSQSLESSQHTSRSVIWELELHAQFFFVSLRTELWMGCSCLTDLLESPAGTRLQ